jgi:hypothetical protein
MIINLSAQPLIPLAGPGRVFPQIGEVARRTRRGGLTWLQLVGGHPACY